jgi:fused signal recognition particle receptor
MGLFDLFKKKKPAGVDAEPGAPETAELETAAPDAAAHDTEPAEAFIEQASAPASTVRAADSIDLEVAHSIDRGVADSVPPLAPAGLESTPTLDTAVPAAPAPPSRLRAALNRTRQYFTAAFTTGTGTLVDADYYDELTDALVLADVGMELSQRLVQRIKTGMNERGLLRRADVPPVAGDVITALLTEGVRTPQPLDPGQLAVILLIGVNGSGKTTLTAKLAARLKGQGLRVLLAAADTFRAAAVDQLKVWAERTGVDIVAGQEGADPAAVVFDAAQAARARGFDVLLVDTAGRLQTKKNLMEELSKVVRTVDKACPGANIAHLLVLDATVGQNALSQAQLFNECCPVTGVALTKLDGTAKGGAVLAVVDALKAPVLYCGVGESAADLADFDAREFALGLVGGD